MEYTIETHVAGGIIGAVIALPLRPLIGEIGTGVVLCALILISFVITTGKQPLIRFAKFVSGSLTEFIQSMQKEREAEKEDDIKISGVEEEKPRKKLRKAAEGAKGKGEDKKDAPTEKSEEN